MREAPNSVLCNVVGGVSSPILANIYLDRLDRFVDLILIPEFTRGIKRKMTPAFARVSQKIYALRKRGGDAVTLAPLRKEQRDLPAADPFDPGYRRLRYIRYADDFLLGFAGPKDEAEEIRGRLGEFLRERLKLELSQEKTLITHAGGECARFLGYDITVQSGPDVAKRARGNVTLRVPPQRLEAKIARYARDGKPIHRPELLAEDDFSIVAKYGSEYRGFLQYYALAKNRYWIDRLHWYMRISLLKTLAAKHRSTVSNMARRYAAWCYDMGRLLKCLEVTIEREGKRPLVARFGGLHTGTDPFAMIKDMSQDRDRTIIGTTEILQRLLADECELCGSRENVQVHHVRKLADLRVRGRKEVPHWKRVMSGRRRKTLVVCEACHDAIHAGRPTRTRSTPQATVER